MMGKRYKEEDSNINKKSDGADTDYGKNSGVNFNNFESASTTINNEDILNKYFDVRAESKVSPIHVDVIGKAIDSISPFLKVEKLAFYYGTGSRLYLAFKAPNEDSIKQLFAHPILKNLANLTEIHTVDSF